MLEPLYRCRQRGQTCNNHDIYKRMYRMFTACFYLWVAPNELAPARNCKSKLLLRYFPVLPSEMTELFKSHSNVVPPYVGLGARTCFPVTTLVSSKRDKVRRLYPKFDTNMKPIDGCPQKFIHPDLAEGQIRLLSLRGGSGSDEVDCDLLIASLDDQVDYEALSYAWGDASDTRPIRLCGQPFHVTVNLESALRNLRQTDRPSILWVDALCTYSNRSRIKHRRNLRFEPLFSEGV
jgi:hypothetical protein